LAMILFVCLDVRLLITSLISSNLSCILTKLSYARYLFFKVSTNGLYFPTIYAFIALETDQRTNCDIENTTHSTKDWTTRTIQRTRGELRWNG
jgi:hypothetical protein